LNIFHLSTDKLVEAVNNFFTELIRKFVFAEVSESLVEQPDVKVGDRVVDVEII
jgi:hypothetical protein